MKESKELGDSKVFGLGKWHDVLATTDGKNYRTGLWGREIKSLMSLILDKLNL